MIINILGENRETYQRVSRMTEWTVVDPLKQRTMKKNQLWKEKNMSLVLNTAKSETFLRDLCCWPQKRLQLKIIQIGRIYKFVDWRWKTVTDVDEIADK